jgi:hypothetical protein
MPQRDTGSHGVGARFGLDDLKTKNLGPAENQNQDLL